jgi:threonine aldolase
VIQSLFIAIGCSQLDFREMVKAICIDMNDKMANRIINGINKCIHRKLSKKSQNNETFLRQKLYNDLVAVQNIFTGIYDKPDEKWFDKTMKGY